jgi:hypothetical protein
MDITTILVIGVGLVALVATHRWNARAASAPTGGEHQSKDLRAAHRPVVEQVH